MYVTEHLVNDVITFGGSSLLAALALSIDPESSVEVGTKADNITLKAISDGGSVNLLSHCLTNNARIGLLFLHNMTLDGDSNSQWG